MTSRKWIGFAFRLGHSSYIAINAYPWRDKDPKSLRVAWQQGHHVTGLLVRGCGNPSEGDVVIHETCKDRKVIVCWGDQGPWAAARLRHVGRLIQDVTDKVYCFGRTKTGQPTHVRCLAYDTPLERFHV